MKKFVAVISILALLFCLVSAFAEGIDLKGLTDDELTKLNDLVRNEMFDRGITFEAVFPAGQYTVGKDIAAGNYDLIITGVESTAGPTIKLYEKREDSDGYREVLFERVRSDGRVHISLENEMVLIVESMTGSITITNAASPFTP